MNKKSSAITIGIDLGDRKHAVCVLDAKGEILKQESIANTRGSLTVLSRRYSGALMVMEVGMHSPWTSRYLKDLGHRVLVGKRSTEHLSHFCQRSGGSGIYARRLSMVWQARAAGLEPVGRKEVFELKMRRSKTTEPKAQWQGEIQEAEADEDSEFPF